MNLSILEIFALIVIVLAAIKLLVLFINPKYWMKVVDAVYSAPIFTSVISLILAGIVLNRLLAEEITIVQIFAVMLFFMMLMLVGFCAYRTVVLSTAHKIFRRKHVLKQAWLYILIWIILLAWALKEIFYP